MPVWRDGKATLPVQGRRLPSLSTKSCGKIRGVFNVCL
nr:MAG TPA: hypothetical protein [Caudoviricetes sp.]